VRPRRRHRATAAAACIAVVTLSLVAAPGTASGAASGTALGTAPGAQASAETTPVRVPARDSVLLPGEHVASLLREAAGDPGLRAALDRLHQRAERAVTRLARKGNPPATGGVALHRWIDPETDEPCPRQQPAVFDHLEHRQRARDILELAVAGRLSRSRPMLDAAADALTAYPAAYAELPLRVADSEADTVTRIGGSPADEARWLLPLAIAADLLRSELDPAQLESVRDGLLTRSARQVVVYNPSGIDPRQVWRNAAAAVVGLLFDDPGLVHVAIDDRDTGDWAQLREGVVLDGRWRSWTWRDHLQVLAARTPLVAVARRSGKKLADRKATAMLRAASTRLTPDGSLAASGASPRYRMTRTVVDLLGAGAAQLRLDEANPRRLLAAADPLYREMPWLVPPAGDAFERELLDAYRHATAGVGARLLVESSRALPAIELESDPASTAEPWLDGVVLRSRTPDALWASTRFRRRLADRGHHDALALLLEDRGGPILVDPGESRRRPGLSATWLRRSMAHNTLTLDGGEPARVSGRLVAADTDPEAPHHWAMLDAGPIAHRFGWFRTLIRLGDQTLIVVDQMRGETPHRLDLTWHLAEAWSPHREPPPASTTQPADPGARRGLKPLDGDAPSPGDLGPHWRQPRWERIVLPQTRRFHRGEGDAVALTVAQFSPAPAWIGSATTPRLAADPAIRAEGHSLVLRTRSTAAVFVTIVRLDGAPASIAALPMTGKIGPAPHPADAFAFVLTTPDGARHHLLINPMRRHVHPAGRQPTRAHCEIWTSAPLPSRD